MIWPFRKVIRPFRKRSRAASLLQQYEAGVAPILGALSDVNLSDAVLDFASKTGVDLGDLVDRALVQLNELAARAGDEASGLRRTDAARRVQELTTRAGELAGQVIGERLIEAVPRRRSSRRTFGSYVLGGLAVGTILAYFVLPRRTDQHRAPDSAVPTRLSVNGNGTRTSPIAPVENAVASLRGRLQRARQEAQRAQQETESDLWRQYSMDVYHVEPLAADAVAHRDLPESN